MSKLRRFLYLSPSFPPQSRVGALRPLKFARHLPEFGWAPIVLCDLHESDAMDRTLVDAVPDSTVVVRDWSRTSRRNEEAFVRGDLPPRDRDAGGKARKSRPSGLKRLVPGFLRNEFRSPSFFWPSPEVIPLGHHSLEIPHGLAAARKILRQQPCEAIVVNADPHAALLVGRSLSREFGIPVINDLRDPWSVCELRRKERPLPQRRLVDWMERLCVEQSFCTVLNTHTALNDYRRHYQDLPAEKFDYIRNHGDASLIAGGSFQRDDDRFTVLFLGNFRRYVEGDQLIEALALLRERGIDDSKLRLVVTGRVPGEAREFAARLGVERMLVDGSFVPYRSIGSYMETADLLVALSNRTVQRVPAKIYDYALASRPILSIADNPELAEMMAVLGGAQSRGLDDVPGIADAIEAEFRAGPGRSIDRSASGLDSRTASGKLAAILDAAAVSGRLSNA
jgi:glycosyltransferase involved in cell wall biosynthesis